MRCETLIIQIVIYNLFLVHTLRYQDYYCKHGHKRLPKKIQTNATTIIIMIVIWNWMMNKGRNNIKVKKKEKKNNDSFYHLIMGNERQFVLFLR